MPRRDEPELDIRAIVLLLAVLSLPAAVPASVQHSKTSHLLFTAAGLAANPIIFLPVAMTAVMLALTLAFQKYGADLDKQQEVVMNISDIIMEVFAMESCLLRTRKIAGTGVNAADMCSVFLREAMDRIEMSAREVIGACSSGEEVKKNVAALRSFARYEPVNSIALRRNIAGRLLSAERYVV